MVGGGELRGTRARAPRTPVHAQCSPSGSGGVRRGGAYGLPRHGLWWCGGQGISYASHGGAAAAADPGPCAHARAHRGRGAAAHRGRRRERRLVAGGDGGAHGVDLDARLAPVDGRLDQLHAAAAPGVGGCWGGGGLPLAACSAKLSAARAGAAQPQATTSSPLPKHTNRYKMCNTHYTPVPRLTGPCTAPQTPAGSRSCCPAAGGAPGPGPAACCTWRCSSAPRPRRCGGRGGEGGGMRGWRGGARGRGEGEGEVRGLGFDGVWWCAHCRVDKGSGFEVRHPKQGSRGDAQTHTGGRHTTIPRTAGWARSA